MGRSGHGQHIFQRSGVSSQGASAYGRQLIDQLDRIVGAYDKPRNEITSRHRLSEAAVAQAAGCGHCLSRSRMAHQVEKGLLHRDPRACGWPFLAAAISLELCADGDPRLDAFRLS